MKKILFTTLLFTVCTLFSTNMNAQNTMKPTEEAVKNLKPYPATIDELERYVIYVEQKSDESAYEIEIIAGKNLEVDCNKHRLQGEFKEETVQGWGFTYYVFDTSGQIMSTMMACPQPKTTKFVAGESTMVRYNSRLPIVVYLPKGMELKYKVWAAGDEVSAKQQ